MHHSGALVERRQTGRKISRETFLGRHLFQTSGKFSKGLSPTGSGVGHDRYIVAHVTVIFCQSESGVNAGFTGSNRHVGSIGNQCSTVHQRFAGTRIGQFTELFQNLCHFISTLTASDIDDDICIGPFGDLMLCHGLSGSESAWDGSGTALCNREHGIDDTLSGNKRDGCRKTMMCRSWSTNRPMLSHCQFFLLSVRKFQTNQRFVNCVFTVCNSHKNSSLYFRRNHTFMSDRMCFRNFCDNITYMEIISLLYSDVCFPFLCTVQRIDTDTACDKCAAGGFCDIFQWTFDTIKNVVQDTGCKCYGYRTSAGNNFFARAKPRCFLINLNGCHIFIQCNDFSD